MKYRIDRTPWTPPPLTLAPPPWSIVIPWSIVGIVACLLLAGVLQVAP